MAPPLHQREGNDAFDAHTVATPEAGDTGNSMAPWLIAVIVIGVLVVASLIVILTLHLTRKRQRIPQEDQADPLGKEFKKRKMRSTDRQAVEEIERATMIRKSLASRTSSRNSQVWGSSEYQFQELDQEDREPVAPREPKEQTEQGENWKEFEAGQIPIPGVQDTQMGIHPALLPQPQLAVRPPPRTPSPSRGPQPPRLIIPS
ncbi:hypothetical protein F4813DRAFT_184176 [Daldinia decipiens]|uniref:uncharacterized protein n=1 Tax=Daldinia decipiens TaxID=326647 RepID=UPI0020C40DAA|nr:uncharacterized protein F4813DRAFT_184176 [Daldinia decipiens]KAI1655203.1 hypothetical protein F4813DRAFT_184176 [Daldinia decipiens]